jgi:hypothetical protein
MARQIVLTDIIASKMRKCFASSFVCKVCHRLSFGLNFDYCANSII